MACPTCTTPTSPASWSGRSASIKGDLNPRFFNWPSLYMYVVAGAYGLVFGWSPDGVAGAFARNPAQFYLVARVLTALFGTATLAVLYLTGRLAYGPTVAILAAGSLAVDLPARPRLALGHDGRAAHLPGRARDLLRAPLLARRSVRGTPGRPGSWPGSRRP